MSHTNLLSVHASERLQAPPDWEAYRFACMPPTGPTLYYEVTGAVAPLVTRGPRKGRRDWKKEDKQTRQTAFIPVTEHEAWVVKWSEKTGLCAECVGDGEVFASWSKDEGTKYRPCQKCRGTGKAAGSVVENQP